MTSASIQNEPPATSTAVESSPTPHRLSPTELAAQAREKIDSDLRIWQEKFTVAADKGIEDLEERINTIVESYISGGAKGRGESLLVSLDEVLEHELAQIKLRINALVESLPAEDAPQEEATAHDELLTEIRQAAIIVRDHAHALREWHETFDQEIERRVSAAVDSTLDVLNSVRDLGLQEIGMRWAWMDGVTYKDWADYHALKAGFNDWRGHIRDVGMQHAKIDEARALSDNILSHGMDGAKAAANELARLKDVGNWKIAAREVSDDFNARTSPPPPLPKCSTAISHTPGNDAEGQDEQDTPVSRGGEHDTDTNSASGSAIDDSETEEHGRGLDDAPLMDDQEHESLRHDEEMRKQDLQSINSSPSFSSEDEGENSATSEQEDAGENNGDRSAWGVAAADVDIEDNNSEDGQSSEVLHDILGAAGDNVAAATKTFDEDLLQPSSSPDLGERSTIEQDSDPQDTSDQPLPHYAAVEDLVALLLEGRESSFAEDVMNKLHAIYGQSISAAPSPTDDVEHAQDTRDSSPVSTTGVPILDNNVEGASEQTQLGINGDPDDETEYLEVSGEASSCIAAENDDLADHVEDTLNRGEL
ncbi:hypothetical protein EYZ11_002884 [Aspergillus tanneri]|nr:hypothetical protein EYZ11_002884 [Aspergillus tanneri]